jgi:hypothetical protein
MKSCPIRAKENNSPSKLPKELLQQYDSQSSREKLGINEPTLYQACWCII